MVNKLWEQTDGRRRTLHGVVNEHGEKAEGPSVENAPHYVSPNEGLCARRLSDVYKETEYFVPPQ
jgi:hypothetical protein